MAVAMRRLFSGFEVDPHVVGTEGGPVWALTEHLFRELQAARRSATSTSFLDHFVTCFSAMSCHARRVICSTQAHAYRMLTGVWNPMLCPITVVRHGEELAARPSTSQVGITLAVASGCESDSSLFLFEPAETAMGATERDGAAEDGGVRQLRHCFERFRAHF